MIWCDASTSIGRDWPNTKRYGVKTLVYFEPHDTIATALQREKNIKHWSREWKVDLIVAGNPGWQDLYNEIVR
jgi:putative endonuclease